MKEAPDRSIWEACAGSSGKTPKVGSLVYYFPRGHGEQAYAPPDFSLLPRERSCYLCRVEEVELLASEETDEIYGVVGLDPGRGGGSAEEDAEEEEEEEEESSVLSFAKVLTPSDANNGGGFSVPRFCADSIFPKLDFGVEPPSQLLQVRDLQGKVWEFRHIFRGTPRRHLLTTGWSRFVNSKRLIAGDSVIFMRNNSGQLFLGLRRTSQSFGAFNPAHSLAAEFAANSSSKLGFRRNLGGKISPNDVIEAARLAERGHPFKIVYYPGSNFSNFLVEKGTVEAALRIPWSVGTRMKMAVETEDPSKMTWLQGTLSSIIRLPPPFNYSPWRSLEVAWDEPEVGYSVKRVSPWEVEVVAEVHVAASKRARKNQEWAAGAAEKKTRTWTNKDSPAGMQGARQDREMKALGGSFQLFGKTILTGHLGAEAAAGDAEREDGGGAVDLCYGFSLSNPGKQFQEEAEKPAQRVPALES